MGHVKVFVYATLKDPKTEKLAMGHIDPETKALLVGYTPAMIEDHMGQKWPTLIRNNLAATHGDIIEADENDLKSLDNWENKYHRQVVSTTAGQAYAYFLKEVK